MHREFIELGAYRLERGWTYRKLAHEINLSLKTRKSAFRLSHSRIYTLLNDPKEEPNDLTLYAIREYLGAVMEKFA